MKIMFIAPPAAGKGTLGLRVSKEYKIPHISTGDLLRNTDDDDLKAQMKTGKLISDDIICDLLYQRIIKNDCQKGYVLDGFPRNIKQAEKYDELLSKLEKDQEFVIVLDLDKELAAKRITGRKSCPNCGAVFNDLFEESKPKQENICDNCGNALTHREDDNIDTFNVRYQTYLDETEPLIGYYEKKGIVFHVDSSVSPDYAFDQIKEILGGLDDNN